MGVSYRTWELKDEPVISKLMHALYQEDPGDGCIEDQYMARTFNRLRTSSETGTIIVIKKDNEVVGYGLLIYYWSNEYGGNIVTIDELYIIEECRNYGIGSLFIKAIIDQTFKECVLVQLETTDKNKRALALYKKLGFVESTNQHLDFYIEK